MAEATSRSAVKQEASRTRLPLPLWERDGVRGTTRRIRRTDTLAGGGEKQRRSDGREWRNDLSGVVASSHNAVVERVAVNPSPHPSPTRGEGGVSRLARSLGDRRDASNPH